MIYKNLSTSGESEAILDLGELIKVQLKDDSVQSFGKKWDGVTVTAHKTPDNKLERLYRMQLEKMRRMDILDVSMQAGSNNERTAIRV